MHSHGHVPLKVTLLVTTHHMTVRSCDPESVQYEATTKTVTADMGPDDLVLGYLWFMAMNTHPDWTTGTLPASIIICTKGVASGKPMHSVWVAGMRTTIQNQPLLEAGEELYLHIIKIDPIRAAKTTVVQQLTKQATDKTVCTWD